MAVSMNIYKMRIGGSYLRCLVIITLLDDWVEDTKGIWSSMINEYFIKVIIRLNAGRIIKNRWLIVSGFDIYVRYAH